MSLEVQYEVLPLIDRIEKNLQSKINQLEARVLELEKKYEAYAWQPTISAYGCPPFDGDLPVSYTVTLVSLPFQKRPANLKWLLNLLGDLFTRETITKFLDEKSFSCAPLTHAEIIQRIGDRVTSYPVY